MVPFDFDRPVDRRSMADCKKWWAYPEPVLPMWVADTDFVVAPPIQEAIRARADHGVFGYAAPSPALKAAVVDMLADRHGWTVDPDWLVFLPGVEPGFNMALKAELRPGDGVVLQTPLYAPLRAAPGNWGLRSIDVPVAPVQGGHDVDVAGLCAALAGARAILLCNPHNPTGRVFTADELSAIAAACERHDVLIIADEIHCDLLFDDREHVPIARLAPEVAARTVTLMSASKTFNIAGLKTAFAIVPDAVLRQRFQAARGGMVDSVNILGLEATRVAYSACEDWRRAMIAYLQANRDHLAAELARRFPGIRHRPPEATFLAWLDCASLDLPDPHRFFVEKAGIGFSAGHEFGDRGAGHVRLNFGCRRAVLDEALDRMERALASR